MHATLPVNNARAGLDLTIDPSARGRQHGVLRLPDPRPDDRWATLEIPVAQIGSGAGPVVTLLADGIEPAGTHALAELARTLDPLRIAGTVRVVPSLGPDPARDAARHAQRSPADDGLRDRLLDALFCVLVEGSELVLELGDAQTSGHRWCNCAVLACDVDARRGPDALESAMIAFGADFSLRMQDATDPPADELPFRPDLCLDHEPDPGEQTVAAPSIASRCRRLGIAHLSTRGHASDSAIDTRDLLIGCRNVLVQRAVLGTPLTLRSSRQLVARVPDALVRATQDGLLEPRVPPGRDVQAGDVLARLLDPARPASEPRMMRAPRAGTVASMRRSGRVTQGDAITLLADEVQV